MTYPQTCEYCKFYHFGSQCMGGEHYGEYTYDDDTCNEWRLSTDIALELYTEKN